MARSTHDNAATWQREYKMHERLFINNKSLDSPDAGSLAFYANNCACYARKLALYTFGSEQAQWYNRGKSWSNTFEDYYQQKVGVHDST